MKQLRIIAPFSLRCHPDRLEIGESTASIVQRIFRDYAGGASLRSLTTALSNEGVLTPRGGVSWGFTTIRNILMHSTYLGKPRQLDIDLPAEVAPTLIDEVGLLRSGVGHCGSCGRSLYVMPRSRDDRYEYQCNAGFVTTACSFSMVTHLRNSAVWGRLRDWLLRDEPLSETLEFRNASDDPSAELTAVARTLSQIERQLTNIVRTIVATDDPDSAAALAATLDELRRRWREVEEDWLTVMAAWNATDRRKRS